MLALKALNGDALARTSLALLQGANLELLPNGTGFGEYANLRLSGGDKMDFSKYQKEEMLRQALEAKIEQIQADFEPE